VHLVNNIKSLVGLIGSKNATRNVIEKPVNSTQ